MNQQRRLTYMKALGIPIWLARTHHSNTNTEAHTEQTPETEQELSYEDQMAMQEYEQYAQYDSSTQSSNVQTSSSSAQIQTSSADALALSLIDSLDTSNTPSSHHIAATTTARISDESPSLPESVDIPSTQIPTEQLTATKMVQADQNSSSANLPVESLNWEDLHQAVKQCQYCEMAKFRSNTVFGSGDAKAKWLFIGEAPDVEDDQQGLPFLAKSGQLLDNILAAINLDRNAVYLTNILKCRPPNDRDPHVDEAKQCMSYLHRQIELIQPKVIVVVGRVATKNLLQIKKPLGQMRGYVHYLGKTDIPVVVTYHPRYLLRQPSAKRKLWEDIQLAQSIVQTSP